MNKYSLSFYVLLLSKCFRVLVRTYLSLWIGILVLERPAVGTIVGFLKVVDPNLQRGAAGPELRGVRGRWWVKRKRRERA